MKKIKEIIFKNSYLIHRKLKKETQILKAKDQINKTTPKFERRIFIFIDKRKVRIYVRKKKGGHGKKKPWTTIFIFIEHEARSWSANQFFDLSNKKNRFKNIFSFYLSKSTFKMILDRHVV